MQLVDTTINIDTTFSSAGEEGEHIKLIVGDQQNAVFHLSLQQARSLATTLIQYVHRAEVKSSMKKTRQEQGPSSLERGGATVLVPTSQQA